MPSVTKVSEGRFLVKRVRWERSIKIEAILNTTIHNPNRITNGTKLFKKTEISNTFESKSKIIIKIIGDKPWIK